MKLSNPPEIVKRSTLTSAKNKLPSSTYHSGGSTKILKNIEITAESQNISSKISNREGTFHFDEKLTTPSVITTENERSKFKSSPKFSNKNSTVEHVSINIDSMTTSLAKKSKNQTDIGKKDTTVKTLPKRRFNTDEKAIKMTDDDESKTQIYFQVFVR